MKKFYQKVILIDYIMPNRKLTIPISTKQEVKNTCLKMLDTKESKKCIKKAKKIDIEKIFIKSKSKKSK